MEKRYKITLTPEERQKLIELVSIGKSNAQKIKHANILLAVDEVENVPLTDQEAARRFHCHVNTVANLRERFVESFGTGIYKIGFTQRENPYHRVWELSDASVPFEFKTHLMIPTDEPCELEKKLHAELQEYRLNKEFYHTDFAVILAAVEKHHGTAEILTEARDARKTETVVTVVEEKTAAPENSDQFAHARNMVEQKKEKSSGPGLFIAIIAGALIASSILARSLFFLKKRAEIREKFST